MRIVAAQAIRLLKGLAVVGLDDRRILRIVTGDTKRRGIFRQMEVKLAFTSLASLVCHVAGIASHVQRGVTAAVLGDIDTNLVAGKAKVRILSVSADRLEQLVPVVGSVRLVAFHTVANCRSVNLAFNIRSFFVSVAGDTERYGSGGDQLGAGNVFIDPDLVTTGTPHGNRRMNRLALGLIFMALRASSRILFGL